MAKRRQKPENGSYIQCPHRVYDSPRFRGLGAQAHKLLNNVMVQYKGNNNGHLSACFSIMRDYGWAKGTLYRALGELEHSGIFVVTRKGVKKRGCPTLLAATWFGIDEPKNGTEFREGIMPGRQSLGYWCTHPSTWKLKPTLKAPANFDFTSLILED
ncbi:hypothetical protein ACJJIW_10015 [Microbulbifer sp. JMSA004]|uniref:hypothetical protein n=1 Tax=Microbulbifer sp. JMSA004 TaxID=3243370 RepID=UPI0040394690